MLRNAVKSSLLSFFHGLHAASAPGINSKSHNLIHKMTGHKNQGELDGSLLQAYEFTLPGMP